MEHNTTKSTSNFVSFLMDLATSVFASIVFVLLVRYIESAVLDFVHQMMVWILISAIASIVALLITRINRIVFRRASFKAVSKVLLFVLVKGAFMYLQMLLFGFNPSFEISALSFAACDSAVTLLVVIVVKIIIIRYYDNVDLSLEKEINKIDIMVYGTGPRSVAAVNRYEQSNNYHIIGFITRERDMADKILMDYPVYYIDGDKLPVRGAGAILFTDEYDRIKESDGLISDCSDNGVCVLTIPRTQNISYPGLGPQEVKQLLDNQFIPDAMTPFMRATKRLLDLIFSSVLILALSPVMLIITTVLFFTDGHPVLFRQERIGRFGRPFTILKFRTMRNDAESDGPALYAGDDDPRLTKVGRFLRIHHLDELPQLFNIFVGDMSFVGYRPERRVFINEIIKLDPRYAYLYQIRPGVTSYATLKNGYTDTMDKMLRRLKFDLYYLNHRNLFFDLRVIVNTFLSVVTGKRF